MGWNECDGRLLKRRDGATLPERWMMVNDPMDVGSWWIDLGGMGWARRERKRVGESSTLVHEYMVQNMRYKYTIFTGDFPGREAEALDGDGGRMQSTKQLLT